MNPSHTTRGKEGSKRENKKKHQHMTRDVITVITNSCIVATRNIVQKKQTIKASNESRKETRSSQIWHTFPRFSKSAAINPYRIPPVKNKCTATNLSTTAAPLRDASRVRGKEREERKEKKKKVGWYGSTAAAEGPFGTPHLHKN
ncbi:hypothetical protein, unlikely [Trypanosoma congolense IL3000]|uniref:Uncharacterized protein n=1 Tax=Trypanosoma congolense (strain IL3000) TaxID=1068625 RepID=F9WF26_TRYCI|nr:hypothetical protein, unlikely [Trypanosoma congolense IL3000]